MVIISANGPLCEQTYPNILSYINIITGIFKIS